MCCIWDNITIGWFNFIFLKHFWYDSETIVKAVACCRSALVFPVSHVMGIELVLSWLPPSSAILCFPFPAAWVRWGKRIFYFQMVSRLITQAASWGYIVDPISEWRLWLHSKNLFFNISQLVISEVCEWEAEREMSTTTWDVCRVLTWRC